MLYYMSNSSEITKQQAYIYASVIAVLTIFTTTLTHNFMLRLVYVGMKMKVAGSWLIYKKSLRLSRNALNDYTVGKIVNLLSNDINRFERGVIHLHTIVLAPIIVVINLYIMYAYVGLTACSGMVGYLLYLPLQSKYMHSLTYKTRV